MRIRSVRKLLLRIRSLLRRTIVKTAASVLVFGDFVLDTTTGMLEQKGAPVKLTSGEREILKLLGRVPGQALARDDLAQAGGASATRKVDVQINRLRQKIETDQTNPRFLVTMRGAGYALMAEPQ